MTGQPASGKVHGKRFRILRIAGVVTFLLAVVVLAAPWVIARTGLRDQLINKIMGTPNLTAS